MAIDVIILQNNAEVHSKIVLNTCWFRDVPFSDWLIFQNVDDIDIYGMIWNQDIENY